VNLLDEEGNTPLHLACHNMHAQIVLFLVSDKGQANIKIPNKDDKLPSQLMMSRAKQANKMKDCEACILTLTNMENSASLNVVSKIEDASHSSKFGLDQFEVLEKLGKGSFGSVYLVRRKDDPKKTNYAMKVLEKDKVLA
jgi:ankyrin repeat protein